MKRDLILAWFFGALIGAVVVGLVGCDDGPVIVAAGSVEMYRPADVPIVPSDLPACSTDVGPDHYCKSGKVACWSFITGTPVGASGCSVSIRDSAGAPIVMTECVPSCLDPSKPIPTKTCVALAQRSIACPGQDSEGLEVSSCTDANGTGMDCISAAVLPPFVARCVPSCASLAR